MKGALIHWALTLHQTHFQSWASTHLFNPHNSPGGLICFPIPSSPGPMFNESPSVSTNSPSWPCSDPTEFLPPLLHASGDRKLTLSGPSFPKFFVPVWP